MPEYSYKARKSNGTAVQGTYTADSETDCLQFLAGEGMMPTQVRVVVKRDKEKRARGSVSVEDLILFTRQLSAVYNAGISLVEGLRLVEGNLENPVLKHAVQQIGSEVQAGESLSDSMARHPRIFQKFYVSAIEAGQASGGLNEILEQLETMLEDHLSLRREIVKALRYPAMVVVAIGIAIAVLFTFVVPSLSPLFDRLGENLPMPTKILLGIRDAFTDYGLTVLGCTVLGILAAVWGMRTPVGRRRWDAIRLQLPLVGKLMQYQLLSRFATTLSLLNKAGGVIVRNLEITGASMASPSVSHTVDKLREEVLGGSSLSDSMSRRPFFPDMMVHLVRTGENTGRLDDFLDFLAVHYRDECRFQARNMVQLIEPALTVVAGGAILFLAFAIFLPYWNMIDAFRGGG